VNGHAAAGGSALDDLISDASFLVAIDQTDLLRALPVLNKPTSLAVAAIYRSTAHKLSEHSGINAAYLELAAYSNDDNNLAAKVRDLRLDQPFISMFVIHARSPSRLTLRSNEEWIESLAWELLVGGPPSRAHLLILATIPYGSGIPSAEKSFSSLSMPKGHSFCHGENCKDDRHSRQLECSQSSFGGQLMVEKLEDIMTVSVGYAA
jgi:hypothetical protein